jgi:hypothetical protein
VTRRVAHSLVPGTGRPRDPPNRRSRSLPSGSVSPSFAPRSNYGTRPYVQSIILDSRRSFTTDHPEHLALLHDPVGQLAGLLRFLGMSGARPRGAVLSR